MQLLSDFEGCKWISDNPSLNAAPLEAACVDNVRYGLFLILYEQADVLSSTSIYVLRCKTLCRQNKKKEILQ